MGNLLKLYHALVWTLALEPIDSPPLATITPDLTAAVAALVAVSASPVAAVSVR
jgi:hypothetical protein